jgi:hypothetical protein
MAKLIPQSLKFVDLVVKVTDTQQLVLCHDCQEPMVVMSVITAELSDDPTRKTVNHNLQCPACGGISFISLRTKV